MDGEFSALSTPDLMAEITMLAGPLNAANARLLALVAELDRRKGWAEWGVKSMAHWLSWKCGFSLGAAREKVRVAHALEQLPKIAAAMADGRLSYFKVREMTRVAEAANEDYLLNIALCGTATHVEETVRGYRRALDAAELTREAIQQRDQSLWWHAEADGSIVIRGRLPAEVGALFVRALQAAQDSLPIPENKNVPAGTFSDSEDLHRSRKRRVEALATLAESFLATGPKDLSGADRHQIVVHVDAETFQHRCAGRCELEQGPSIAAETARRLACDASVVRILENEGASPWMWAEKPVRFRRRSAALSVPGTRAADSRAAASSATSTGTTCNTGPTAARPSSATSSRSAASTIAWCTKGRSRSERSTTAHSGS